MLAALRLRSLPLRPSMSTKRPHPFFVAAGLKTDADGNVLKKSRPGAVTSAATGPAPRLAPVTLPPPPPRPAGNYDPATDRPPRDPSAFVALSWNVAGLNGLLRKDPDAISRLVAAEQADALCLQEHKLQSGNVADAAPRLGLPGWHITWATSEGKKGYSGVAIASRLPPLSVRVGMGDAAADDEGRIVAAEYPRFWLVTAYVPNAGEKLVRLDYRVGEWDAKLAAFLASLATTKPVILAGDLNCARQEADIHNPKTNLRSAGFTVEERESFAAKLLGDPARLTDPWRERYPDARGYTYWSYRFGCRPKNLGWRIDYVLTSPELSDSIHDAFQLPHVEGSDHCPVGIAIKCGVGEVEAEAGKEADKEADAKA